MTYANKKSILKFGVIMIIGVVLASATISAGVLADTPVESDYSEILIIPMEMVRVLTLTS